MRRARCARHDGGKCAERRDSQHREPRLAGGERLPGRLGALGGRGLGVLGQQGLETGLDGHRHPLGLLRLALDRVDDTVAKPADAVLHRTASSWPQLDELLPARQHLAAQQGAVRRGPSRRRPARRRTPCRRLRAARTSASRRSGGVGHLVGCGARWCARRPRRVCLTTPARASASAASDPSHPLMSATSAGASRPSSSTAASWTVKSGESLRPRLLASIRARCVETVSTASTGVRSRTTATAADRSGGLAQEVPRHLVGGPRRSRRATCRPQQELGGQGAVALLDRVEVVRIASPGGRCGGYELESLRPAVVACVTRSRSGGQCPNHSAAGLCTSTGERVVGRSTPGSLTSAPDHEFTSVDLPAPVADHGQERSVDRHRPRGRSVRSTSDEA